MDGKKSEVATFPFFEIKSQALKVMLGVKDSRSVIKKLNELGVPIKGKGRSQYIITTDVIDILNQDERITTYRGKTALSQRFK